MSCVPRSYQRLARPSSNRYWVSLYIEAILVTCLVSSYAGQIARWKRFNTAAGTRRSCLPLPFVCRG